MPTMPKIPVILFDATSEANTALDTGKIDVRDFDSLSFHLISQAVIGTPSVSYEIYDAAGNALAVATGALTTGSTRALGGWGPGCSSTVNGLLGLATSLPAEIRIQVGALGSLVTGRLIVTGRKVFRGIGM